MRRLSLCSFERRPMAIRWSLTIKSVTRWSQCGWPVSIRSPQECRGRCICSPSIPPLPAKVDQLNDDLQGRPIEVDDIPRLEWPGTSKKHIDFIRPLTRSAASPSRPAKSEARRFPRTRTCSCTRGPCSALRGITPSDDSARSAGRKRWSVRCQNSRTSFRRRSCKCIGDSLATVETALLIGTIAQAWRLSLVPGAASSRIRRSRFRSRERAAHGHAPA